MKVTAVVIVSIAIAFSIHSSESVNLSVESWRKDDEPIWRAVLIPAFERTQSNIRLQFEPTYPSYYDDALLQRLEAGVAGDLITCRSFDRGLKLFEKGYLVDLSDLAGLENFPSSARRAWSTDDGKITFCLPIASVIHGFLYNREIFSALKIDPPKTESEFFTVLDTLATNGFVPLAFGTAEPWAVSSMGFHNIGPNYWHGERGRKGLISGIEHLNDSHYIAVWDQLSRWAPYLGGSFTTQTNPQSQALFLSGQAAIYPAGSWDVGVFKQRARFAFGAFPPPLPEGHSECYISDHTDIGIGINAASPNIEAAKEVLRWMTSARFARLYSNALAGFFSLSKHPIEIEDPVASQFASWRKRCKSTIRNSAQILSRGRPSLESMIREYSVDVVNGEISPKMAAEAVHNSLSDWYAPTPGR